MIIHIIKGILKSYWRLKRKKNTDCIHGKWRCLLLLHCCHYILYCSGSKPTPVLLPGKSHG